MFTRIATGALAATCLIVAGCASPNADQSPSTASSSATPVTSSSAPNPSMELSAEAPQSASDEVTAMTVREGEVDGKAAFDYSGLTFILPPGTTHEGPREGAQSWNIRFEVPGLTGLALFSWLGNQQVGSGMRWEDTKAYTDEVISDWAAKGVTATSHPLTVGGSSDSVLLTWVEPATEDTKEVFPDIDAFACKVAYILGRNGYFYEATFCCQEGDAAGEALTDEAIATLSIDTGYPKNR